MGKYCINTCFSCCSGSQFCVLSKKKATVRSLRFQLRYYWQKVASLKRLATQHRNRKYRPENKPSTVYMSGIGNCAYDWLEQTGAKLQKTGIEASPFFF